MKKITILFILIFSTLLGNSINTKIIEVIGIKENLILIKENKKYLFLDTTGKEAINSSFDNAKLFSEGLAPVKKNGKWGYIDKFGEKIIEYSYDYADNFSEGLAVIMKNKKMGFIDKKGNLNILSKYDDIGRFENGISIVKKNNKYGLINKDGKELISPKYDYIDEFYEEIAGVLKDGSWGYINKNGEEVLPCIYEFTGNFYNGIARISKNGKYGYINKDGKIIIGLKYKEASSFSEAGFAIVDDGTNYYIINKNDKIVKTLEYTHLSYNIFGVSNNSFIDTYGSIFVDSKGENRSEFSSVIGTNQAYIIAKEKYQEGESKRSYERYDAIFDKNGKQLTPFKYFFYDDAMLASVDDYSYNEPYFINGYSVVRIATYNEEKGYEYLYGLIDKTGRELIPVEYKEIYNSTGDIGLLIDKKSQNLGVYSISSGKVKINWIFKGIIKENTD